MNNTSVQAKLYRLRSLMHLQMTDQYNSRNHMI